MAAAKNVEARVRRLRAQVVELLSAEKHDKAAEVYAELTRLEPDNGEWPRRAADCHWHMNNPDQRLKFSLLAAKAYSESGLMLKAIAMCKIVLSIDPNHRETQEQLARFHSLRPKAPLRRRPVGVKLHGIPLGARPTQPNKPDKPDKPELPADQGMSAERRAERTRARMAAAAALRMARAQKRKDALAAARNSDVESERKADSYGARGSEQGLLAPDPKPQRPAPHDSRQPTGNGTAATPGREPIIPLLNLNLTPSRGPTHPALEALSLSQHVPAKVKESTHPKRGNVYSLTLEDIPEAELRAARIPIISAPQGTTEHGWHVPVIDPLPERKTPVDSLIPGDLSFNSRLSNDREALSTKSFNTVPLLNNLDPEVLRQLITDVAIVELDTNEVLFHEGDPADSMYVVVEGSVTAVTLPHGEKPIELAHLTEGEFFGEIGLMSDQPRQATISAHEPCRLLRFDRTVVAMLVEKDPSFLATLLHFLKNRLVEDLMMNSPLFAPFDEQERYDLAAQFEFLEIEPNSVLLERGQYPIGMYVLLTGEASMKGASEAGTLRRLGPGDIFGEQALLTNAVSQVEVRTTNKSFALCLPSDAFPEVVMTHPTVLTYLSTLNENSKGELDVAEDFLDHVRFF